MKQKPIRERVREITFDEACTRRTHDRIFRPEQNRAYVDAMPDHLYKAIIAELASDTNKKKIANKYRVPHNIVMYIWRNNA